MTLIQRPNNVVCAVGSNKVIPMTYQGIWTPEKKSTHQAHDVAATLIQHRRNGVCSVGSHCDYLEAGVG